MGSVARYKQFGPEVEKCSGLQMEKEKGKVSFKKSSLLFAVQALAIPSIGNMWRVINHLFIILFSVFFLLFFYFSIFLHNPVEKTLTMNKSPIIGIPA